MRTGQTLRGAGWRAQSTVRWPIQTIGAAVPPISVGRRSPGRSASTAASPREVAMRVPAAKQGTTTLLVKSDAVWGLPKTRL